MGSPIVNVYQIYIRKHTLEIIYLSKFLSKMDSHLQQALSIGNDIIAQHTDISQCSTKDVKSLTSDFSNLTTKEVDNKTFSDEDVLNYMLSSLKKLEQYNTIMTSVFLYANAITSRFLIKQDEQITNDYLNSPITLLNLLDSIYEEHPEFSSPNIYADADFEKTLLKNSENIKSDVRKIAKCGTHFIENDPILKIDRKIKPMRKRKIVRCLECESCSELTIDKKSMTILNSWNRIYQSYPNDTSGTQ